MKPIILLQSVRIFLLETLSMTLVHIIIPCALILGYIQSEARIPWLMAVNIVFQIPKLVNQFKSINSVTICLTSQLSSPSILSI